jgi:hypothetical protein
MTQKFSQEDQISNILYNTYVIKGDDGSGGTVCNGDTAKYTSRRTKEKEGELCSLNKQNQAHLKRDEKESRRAIALISKHCQAHPKRDEKRA